jgi:hypothetical protein
MLLESVRSWLGGAPSAPGTGPPFPGEPEDAREADPPAKPEGPWPAARIDVCEQIWGEGFLFPGGGEEVMRLARPLGLSSAATLLLVGAGSGGPPRTIASQLGVWVSGFESDPDLAALAMERCTRARLGRRAMVEMWYPQAPSFRIQAYHHGLALEPLRDAKPEPVLAALTGALRPRGQLMLVEAIADEPLDPADPLVAEWRRVERRSAELPTERSITRMFGRLGFEVRVAEDVTQRYIHLAVLGWRTAVRDMKSERPPPPRAARIVAEAELWLIRLRMMREGRVRMVRWHAISTRRELA